MDVKKWPRILIAVITLAGASACTSNADTSTPEGVATAWLQAQEDGDAEKLAELTLSPKGHDWIAESPWLATRTSGIVDAELVRIEDSPDRDEPEAHVRWTVEGGNTVETILTLESMGNKYKVRPPEKGVANLSPAELQEQWVSPDSLHLDQGFVPECPGDGEETWCYDANGFYDYQSSSSQLPMLPFGTYEYVASSRAYGVTGASQVTAVISDYGDTEITIEPGLTVKPEAIEEIDGLLADYIERCPVVGPKETGDCQEPEAPDEVTIHADGWRIAYGAPPGSPGIFLYMRATPVDGAGAAQEMDILFQHLGQGWPD
ncbi:hypothetical protein [Ancrocorticia sp.]|uniref:hypothetical protein n=1 Tax=Ancrocorticia sp. TaxID=2593684 RepID=UPI003F922CAE